MTRILLIRHGNTDLVRDRLCGRLPGISLNKEGREQARNLAIYLHNNFSLKAVYSSPLERTVETAELIGMRQEVPVSVDEGLIELEFGEWTGMPFEDLHRLEEWHIYNRNRALVAAPGGESLTVVQTRAWKSLSEIRRHHENATVAAVTHGDVIRAVLVLLLGMPLDHLLRLQVEPASVTEILLGTDSPMIVAINRIAPTSEAPVAPA